MKKIPVRHIAPPTSAPAMSGKFNIREVQQILGGTDVVHDIHKHDFYFVLVLQKGQGIHEIDFIEYKVHDDIIFILRPGQVHRLELKAGTTGFLMEFDKTFYHRKDATTDDRWKKAFSKNYCEVQAGRFTKLYTLLSTMFNEFTEMQEGYIEAIKANLDLFFIEYVRQSPNPKNIAKTESGYVGERFEELVYLLEENIISTKNVSQYADMLNLSAYQLNAITKSTVGKTLSELINEQITLEAKRNLLATSNQIKDIAWDLGYEDVSYFIRFFKKHTGHSPDAFRKKFK